MGKEDLGARGGKFGIITWHWNNTSPTRTIAIVGLLGGRYAKSSGWQLHLLLLAAVHCFCGNLVDASSGVALWGGELIHSGWANRTYKPRLKPAAHFNYHVLCNGRVTLFACCADRISMLFPGQTLPVIPILNFFSCLAIWVGSGVG